MIDLKGKKLLIIGGAAQHCKVVEAAHELGIITYVTDYLPLEKAPAKQISDHYFMYNVTDIDEIVAACKAENINGVISTNLDICQKPYQQVCEKLGFPCFGTKKQFDILTDKKLFKEYCRKSGVDTIPEYTEEDFSSEEVCKTNVSFPVIVKPGESRGSRGQTICQTYTETLTAIEFARSVSSNGRVVIEKYMGQNNDFSMSILMLNGKAYVTRTVDRVLGKYQDNLDRLCVGSATPSIFTDLYMNNVHKKVEKLYQDIGIVTAPLFMQGFVDGDTVRFYDPGLRFGGSEFERVFYAVMGRNIYHPLIEYALTGKISEDKYHFEYDDIYLKGKTVGQVFPTLRAGKITSITGLDEIRKHPNTVCVFTRYGVGDTIEETHNVNQRFAEIYLACEDNSEMKKMVEWVLDTLKVYGTDDTEQNRTEQNRTEQNRTEQNSDMLISKYDTSIFANRIKVFGR